MAFEIQRSQRSLPGTTGGVRASLDVDIGGQMVGQALYGLGQTITQEGIKYELMEAATQLSEAKMRSTEEMNKYALSLEGNLDASTYHSGLDRTITTIQGLTPRNRMASNAFSQWMNTMTPQWRKATEESRRNRISDKWRAQGFNLREQYVQQGGYEDYMNYITHLHQGVKLGAYTAEQREMYLDGAIDDREKFASAEEVKAKKLQKEQYDAYVEEIEQEWLIKLRKGELNEIDIMASGLEVDKKQEWLGYVDAQKTEILKGKEPVTDEEVKGSLEDMAYSIWTGAVSKDEFLKQLKVARYEDKTLDDASYDELLSLGQREFKAYQAQSLQNAIAEAKDALVELSEGGWAAAFISNLPGIEKEKMATDRKTQLANWGRYRKALQDWFKKNPDADADEIYIQGKTILATFQGIKPPETPTKEMDLIGPQPPSGPPPKGKDYTGFTVLQDGTTFKWTWDGKQWQPAAR